jgi:hypothetical protein
LKGQQSPHRSRRTRRGWRNPQIKQIVHKAMIASCADVERRRSVTTPIGAWSSKARRRAQVIRSGSVGPPEAMKREHDRRRRAKRSTSSWCSRARELDRYEAIFVGHGRRYIRRSQSTRKANLQLSTAPRMVILGPRGSAAGRSSAAGGRLLPACANCALLAGLP